MPDLVRRITRLQDADDAPALGAGQDGYALVWDNDAGAFVATGAQTFSNGITTGSIRPIADSTTALRIFKADGVTPVVTLDSSGTLTPRMLLHVNANIGVAGNADLNAAISALPTYAVADVSAGYYAINAITFHQPPSVATGIVYGLRTGARGVFGNVQNLTGGYRGIESNVQWRSSGNVDTLHAGFMTAINLSTGTVSDARALWAEVNNSGGGVITTAYGVYIGTVQGTTAWGLYSPTIVNSAHAGNVKFGVATTPTAIVDIAPGTPATAQMRLEAGVAPTTPNDGDVWFDGTALRIRIGGVTRTVTVT